MRQGIKRPVQAYFFHGLWIAMVIFWSATNSSEIGRWILWIGATAGTISLIHMTLKRNYFEVTDNKLIINEGIFRTKIIDLDKIEKFDIEPGPFTASKIILKDKTKIKYSDNQTDDKKLKELMGQYNIPVE
jgi:membrane protein YdbS with pleckstrin-like domain